MCGRYTQYATADDVAEHFGLAPDDVADLRPRYNIAPTQPVPAVGPAPEGEGRGLARFRWGLVPGWADDPADLPDMINARSETAHEKPAFRASFARRRCLLPATGFYEWRAEEGGKQPYHVRRGDGEVFAFAGIWDRWEDPRGERLDSCAILTTEAAGDLKELHDRMPVILRPEDYDRWLDPGVSERGPLEDLLSPPEIGELEYYPVTRRMNRPRFDEPACVEPLEGRSGTR